MDATQIAMLREVLSATGWLERTREFAQALRVSTKAPGGLLLVGTPADEPWHLAAHLDDESRLSRIPELKPTLVRWAPPPGAPPHLSIGLERLESAGRGESLFVVAPKEAPVPLLERVDEARRTGAVILTLGTGDRELTGLAHESLVVPAADRLVTFDGAQHLVSTTVGELARTPRGPRPYGRPSPGHRSQRGLRERLAKFLETVSGPSLD